MNTLCSASGDHRRFRSTQLGVDSFFFNFQTLTESLHLMPKLSWTLALKWARLANLRSVYIRPQIQKGLNTEIQKVNFLGVTLFPLQHLKISTRLSVQLWFLFAAHERWQTEDHIDFFPSKSRKFIVLLSAFFVCKMKLSLCLAENRTCGIKFTSASFAISGDERFTTEVGSVFTSCKIFNAVTARQCAHRITLKRSREAAVCEGARHTRGNSTYSAFHDLILAPVNFNGIMIRSRKAELDSPSYFLVNYTGDHSDYHLKQQQKLRICSRSSTLVTKFLCAYPWQLLSGNHGKLRLKKLQQVTLHHHQKFRGGSDHA